MNEREAKMVHLLEQGRDNYGVVSVKAEFEAEGTRPDELLRLVDIAARVGLPLTLKIGGCEAMLDLMQARQFGASFIVAPMIESTYALSKYVSAKDVVFDPNERATIQFLFNVETVTGESISHELVQLAASGAALNGVVFGRSDFVGSLGLPGHAVNDSEITSRVETVAQQCRDASLDIVVGGGVSIDSLPALRRLRATHLTRFETRKVVFSASALDARDVEQGLLNAVHFELLWLLNKSEYYGRIHREDERRIRALEERWHVLANDVT